MSSFDWVMSAGGALICLDEYSVPTWGGIFRLTIEAGGANNDYERTYLFAAYLSALSIARGKALIFGEGPLDTSFWKAEDDTLFVIRIFCCEHDADDAYFDDLMSAMDPNLFDGPKETLEFDVTSSRLVMFDSANDGTDIADKIVSIEIEPGSYRILTQTYDPDPSCSLILHRFDRLA